MRLIWIQAVACGLLTGCETVRNNVEAIQGSLRTPGEHQEASEAEVWTQAGCARRQLPFVRLEQVDAKPGHVRRGGTFNYRFVYALCTGRKTASVVGQLRTRIQRGRDTVLSDTVPDFALKGGRWVVDITIKVPATAPSGSYGVDLNFYGPTSFAGNTLVAVY